MARFYPNCRIKAILWETMRRAIGLVEKAALLSSVKPKGLGFTSLGRSPGNRVRKKNQSPERARALADKSLYRPFRAPCWWTSAPGALPRAFESEPFGLDGFAPQTFRTGPHSPRISSLRAHRGGGETLTALAWRGCFSLASCLSSDRSIACCTSAGPAWGRAGAPGFLRIFFARPAPADPSSR